MPFDRHAALAGSSRRALLRVLQGSGEALDVRTLAGLVGLHPNSAREQLRALVEAGLVGVSTAAPSGRGRPGLRYSLAPDTEVDPYRLLAGVLADELAHRDDDSAAMAGERWGRQAASTLRDGDPGRHEADPVEAVVTLMAEAGFEPEVPAAPDGELWLHACPFLPIEGRHLQVVCGVHLGFMRGALRELGSTRDVVALDSLVRPDLCVAHLGSLNDA